MAKNIATTVFWYLPFVKFILARRNIYFNEEEQDLYSHISVFISSMWQTYMESFLGLYAFQYKRSQLIFSVGIEKASPLVEGYSYSCG